MCVCSYARPTVTVEVTVQGTALLLYEPLALDTTARGSASTTQAGGPSKVRGVFNHIGWHSRDARQPHNIRTSTSVQVQSVGQHTCACGVHMCTQHSRASIIDPQRGLKALLLCVCEPLAHHDATCKKWVNLTGGQGTTWGSVGTCQRAANRARACECSAPLPPRGGGVIGEVVHVQQSARHDQQRCERGGACHSAPMCRRHDGCTGPVV